MFGVLNLSHSSHFLGCSWTELGLVPHATTHFVWLLIWKCAWNARLVPTSSHDSFTLLLVFLIFGALGSISAPNTLGTYCCNHAGAWDHEVIGSDPALFCCGTLPYFPSKVMTCLSFFYYLIFDGFLVGRHRLAHQTTLWVGTRGPVAGAQRLYGRWLNRAP